MFFQLSPNGLEEIRAENIQNETLTIGYLNAEELSALNSQFRFDDADIEACRNANTLFRSGVEVHSDYTFTELRILDPQTDEDDYIALFLKRNLMLVIGICDEDGSTREKYLAAIRKYPPQKCGSEKILAAFLDSLLAKDYQALETIELDLTQQEETLFKKEVDKDFNLHLLQTKKLLSKRYSYYAQLIDIADAVVENDNDIFDDDRLIYVDNTSKRLTRLKEDTSSLKNTVEHLQDAYNSYLDSNMNNTMKIFTVLTSIFFPLTIIVGWYGMNFKYMPELNWPYGYVYVIVLSALTVLVFAIIGKWKKWF